MALGTMEILRIDDVDSRMYASGDLKFPSVTTVTSKFQDKSFLWKWRAKVGEEEANRISRESANTGTKVHASAEAHFTGEHVVLTKDQQTIREQLQPFLDTVVAGLEHEAKVMWYAHLTEDGRRDPAGKLCGVGGTIDALHLVNGASFVNKFNEPVFSQDTVPIVCDYKTKRKQSKPEWMLTYYLQAVAYMGAVNQMTDKLYSVQDAMIVCATGRSLAIYHLDPVKVGFYWREWLQMLACYFYDLPFDWEGFKNRAIGEINPETGIIEKSYLPERIYIKQADLLTL